MALLFPLAGLPLPARAATGAGLFAVTATAGTDSYTFEGNTLTIVKDDSFTIMQEQNGPITDNIVVAANIKAEITISGLHIDVSASADSCAFELQSGAQVDLILVDENTLQSGQNRAGLEVPEGAARRQDPPAG